MPSPYPSPEAAYAETRVSGLDTWIRLNIGDGTASQDTAGSVTNINAAAGTFDTVLGGFSDDELLLRRDMQGPLASYDATNPRLIIEYEIDFGNVPWAVNGNGMNVGFWLLDGTADANLLAGLSVYYYAVGQQHIMRSPPTPGAVRTTFGSGPYPIYGVRGKILIATGVVQTISIATLNAAGNPNVPDGTDTYAFLAPITSGDLYVAVVAGHKLNTAVESMQASVQYAVRSEVT